MSVAAVGLPDLTTDEAAVVMREFAFRASRELLRKATIEFDRHGPHDPRGAAIWDAGTWLWEKAMDELREGLHP